MKEDKETIKKIIIDVQKRDSLSISWLQKKYKIGFILAKEIYCECEGRIRENKLRNMVKAISKGLSPQRAEVLLDETNKVIANGGTQRMMLAYSIAEMLNKKQIQYVVLENLASSYLAYELKIHNIDCFKYRIRPEICHGIDYRYEYPIEFRISPEEIHSALSCLDKKLNNHLLREFTVYKNGNKGIINTARYYVVDSSIRSLTEDLEVDNIKYKNCINNETACENRDKLIKITISGNATLSIAYDCTKKISNRPLSQKKTKEKGIVFPIEKSIENNEDLLKMLLDDNNNFHLPGLAIDFINPIIKETNASSLSDFIRIMSVVFGTGAWNDNQENYFRDTKRPLNLLIGSRDDVFDLAISKGISVKESLEIMESVRKGKGIREQYREVIGNEFFDILNKIKYLIPRGHILQLIKTALSVLLLVKNYPIEYYASRLEYYNVFKVIDDSLLTRQNHDLEKYIDEKQKEYSQLDSESRERTTGVVIKEKIRIAKLLIMMNKDGISLLKPDFNKSDSCTILIDYDKKTLLLPLYSLPISEDVAEAVVSERGKGKFRSFEDLRRRTGMSATTIEELKNIMFIKDNLY